MSTKDEALLGESNAETREATTMPGRDEPEVRTEGALALAPSEVDGEGEHVTREQRRSRRKRAVRARTISV